MIKSASFCDLQTTGQFWTHEGYLPYSAAECNLPPVVKKKGELKGRLIHLLSRFSVCAC